jgi:hypothetical protein
MASHPFTRLSTVAKILQDQALEELRRENRELRTELYWKDHSLCLLKNLMQYANWKEGGPQCRCGSCAISMRCHDDDNIVGDDCLFDPYFTGLLEKCELTYFKVEKVSGDAYGMSSSGFTQEVSPEDMDKIDAHFVVWSNTDWIFFGYGGKLTKAKFGDKDLLKLHNLFKELDPRFPLADE